MRPELLSILILKMSYVIFNCQSFFVGSLVMVAAANKMAMQRVETLLSDDTCARKTQEVETDSTRLQLGMANQDALLMCLENIYLLIGAKASVYRFLICPQLNLNEVFAYGCIAVSGQRNQDVLLCSCCQLHKFRKPWPLLLRSSCTSLIAAVSAGEA